MYYLIMDFLNSLKLVHLSIVIIITRRSSPISHDSHLLMKLDQAINTGN